ncbi:MAG TPA: dTDP-4-dehydrorhamnose 3,5-epimerase [Catalimonadaceae bacterium]|nr:dTDP-4-dehydrorhamnose 3,5-epimerase [Catalimonadaceae bacterium]HPI11359.1 dTDP-4-dehydrorhamnose 3,5-epimerase [Catalimonadaceae bacterium]
MEVSELALKGIIELRPRVFEDERGYFFESYNEKVFADHGIDVRFVQDNQSFSTTGVVRGLHFQAPPFAQGKLVRVISGRVLDVVVDIRKESPTYGQSLSVELTGTDQKMLYIPPGFAHGFSVLEDAVFQYKCSNLYHKASEMGIHPLDPDLNIFWGTGSPVVSAKDLELPAFQNFNSPF